MITCLDISNRAIGNALFNYYFLLTVADKTGHKPIYPVSQEFMHHSGQRIQQLQSGFNINIDKMPVDEINKHLKYIYREHQDNIFDEDVFNIEDDTNFTGYFQNRRFFNLDDKKNIEFKDSIIEQSLLVLEKLGVEVKDFVSIHVRRGDYLKIDQHPVQTMDYYNKAVDQFPNRKFLVFSDDYEWIKNNFDSERFVCFPTQKDAFIDLYCMSACSDNIIANSTFSWWGAFLNKTVDKTIVYPDNWFKGKSAEIFPEDWVKI